MAVYTDRLPAPIRWALRKRRAFRFDAMLRGVRTWPGMSVLDVGCGIDGRSFSDHADPSWHITGLDVHPPELVKHAHSRFTYHRGNAADLSDFSDQSFDLVVSIGMLEHIVEPEAYRGVCAEMQRVGRQYLVLVPWKWAWIEPHYGFPFFGALPHGAQRWLIRTLNLCGHREHLDYFEKNFAWRSNAQYRMDFPGAKIKLLPPTLETIVIAKT